LIPYIFIPTQTLFGFLPIQPFGILVGIGLVVGYYSARRRARRLGLDPEDISDSIIWVAGLGFIVAHLVSVVFYFPERILQDPLILVKIWNGLSSFGGFLGGVLGGVIYFKRRGLSIVRHADALIYGLLPGWIFGRMGCSVVHDHPGKVTTFFLGVVCRKGDICPSPYWTPGGPARHDLGFYELLYTLVLTTVLFFTRNTYPFYGFHSLLVLVLYAPVRFGFDFLRAEDKTYGGLTPGQYFSIVLFVWASLMMVAGFKRHKEGEQPVLYPAGVRPKDAAEDNAAEDNAAENNAAKDNAAKDNAAEDNAAEADAAAEPAKPDNDSPKEQ
jgi:phosphatidylglycerol:prolipoprotein diacylglycerol transferase